MGMPVRQELQGQARSRIRQPFGHPTGVAMNTETELDRLRQVMIEQHLKARGIRDTSVLSAMQRVPRESFCSATSLAEAYADRALPIHCGQTISQPYMVAVMTECLELSGQERVLEIGTGSGYQTAVLAELAGHVFTVERHDQLAGIAAERLVTQGYTNFGVKVGDGTLGWPEHAPFDRILITAATRECPPALFDQLVETGILVGPFGAGDFQVLQVIRKLQGRADWRAVTGCRFVPLIGEQGEPG
jgi:protein-L-isoaspartate(D-aspartate) O-methyltransferase